MAEGVEGGMTRTDGRPVYTVTAPNGLEHVVEADTSRAAKEEVARIFGTPVRLLEWRQFKAPIVAPSDEVRTA